MELTESKILLTGGSGFLGQEVATELFRRGVPPGHISIPRTSVHDIVSSKKDVPYGFFWSDLLSKEFCEAAVFGKDIVIHCAGNVGGIGKNQREPGTLVYQNALMGLQLMEAARLAGVKKFVTIGTVCSYPKHTPVPFREDDLWNGYPEETNAPYGLAKKLLLVQGQAYRQQYGMNVIHLLPVNLYGPGDNFDPNSSHVIPALIRKFDEAIRSDARYVSIWGSGKPTREFLYVKDAAQAIVAATEKYDGADPVNLGSGHEISIRTLAGLIKRQMGYEGRIRYDKSKPDGQPRRCLDISRALARFDWQAQTPFRDGLARTIKWYYDTAKERK